MREMDHKVAAAKNKMRDAWKRLERCGLPNPQVDNASRREVSPEVEEEEGGEMDDEEEDNEDAESEEEDDDDPGPWHIGGEWTIDCPSISYYTRSPMIIHISTSEQRFGHQTYGRFDFGGWSGVLRFITRDQGQGHGYDAEEFILGNSDMPSEENPTCHYRWRGIDDGEEVIQLGSDNHLYSMKFSNNGNVVKGTWGWQGAEPGTVNFTGI